MIKLRDMLEILPKYDTNNSYGKIGDIKSIVHFYYDNEDMKQFKDLTEELIDNSIVVRIEPTSSSYYNHSNAYLMLYCEEIKRG